MKKVYWFVGTFLLLFPLCLIVVVIKLTWWPVCSSPVSCIDGWTVAGLAATIMGIGATFLGVLAALAVAVWWLRLEERVDKQVKSMVEPSLSVLESRIESIDSRDTMIYRNKKQYDEQHKGES